MEERSPKRRRVSGSPSDGEQQQQRTSRRASYMSPTKASLARFNPTLLKSPRLSKSPRRSSVRRTSIPGEANEDTETNTAAAPDVISRATGGDDEVDSPSGSHGLFEDLDLDNNTRTLATADTQAAVEGIQDSTPVAGPINNVANSKAMEASIKEKEGIQQELSSLKQSCRRLEQFLDRTDTGKRGYDLDSAAMEKLSLILDDADELDDDSEARPISTFLDSLLPFSNPVHLDIEDDGMDSDIPSHRPLELNDPLPCLQLFTSLRCSLRQEAPRTEKDVQDGVLTLQRQHLRINDAKRLLSANIDFEVSSSADETVPPRITTLSVADLPGWTLAELWPWVHEREQDRDLGCLTYGLGSYFEMSLTRGSVLDSCEQRHLHLRDNNLDEGKGVATQLGRKSLVLANGEVLFRVEWTIQLDWTGEATSRVTAKAAFAPACMSHRGAQDTVTFTDSCLQIVTLTAGSRFRKCQQHLRRWSGIVEFSLRSTPWCRSYSRERPSTTSSLMWCTQRRGLASEAVGRP